MYNEEVYSYYLRHKPQLLTVFLLTTFVAASFYFFYLYYYRIGAHSFGDEWHNIVVAYFMQSGRVLHSQIFHNHQMLGPYMSYAIQIIFQPDNLYQVMLFHRMSVWLFGFVIGFVLVLRFRVSGLMFVFLYELTKYYLFGNLFLPESFVVYPLVYQLGVVLEKFNKRKIYLFDYYASAICTWFVMFMREPYVLVTLFLFGALLYKSNSKIFFRTIMLLVGLSVLTIFTLLQSVSDYLYQVFAFNISVAGPNETSSEGGLFALLLKAFLYPFYIFIAGQWNMFHIILGIFSFLLLLQSFFLWKSKKLQIVIIILIALGFAGIRSVVPGKIFFEAFHMLPWYGLFVFAVIWVYRQNFFEKNKKIIVGVSSFGFIAVILLVVFSKESYLWEKVNKEELFTVNYSHYTIPAEVIKSLAKPGDTLFTDFWDYLLYQQTGLDSSYKYAIYTFVMKNDPLFVNEREKMLENNPPVFYYTYCSKGVYKSPYISEKIASKFIELQKNNKGSCIYIRRDKIYRITQEQRGAISRYGYTLP